MSRGPKEEVSATLPITIRLNKYHTKNDITFVEQKDMIFSFSTKNTLNDIAEN